MFNLHDVTKIFKAISKVIVTLSTQEEGMKMS